MVSRFQRDHLLHAAIVAEPHNEQTSAGPVVPARFDRIGAVGVNEDLFQDLSRVHSDGIMVKRKVDRQSSAPIPIWFRAPFPQSASCRLVQHLVLCCEDSYDVFYRAIWSKF